jgi:hypothetical protein
MTSHKNANGADAPAKKSPHSLNGIIEAASHLQNNSAAQKTLHISENPHPNLILILNRYSFVKRTNALLSGAKLLAKMYEKRVLAKCLESV